MHTYLRFLLNFDGKNLAILRLAFSFDVLSEVLVPVAFSLPARYHKLRPCLQQDLNVLLWVKHVLQEDRPGLHRLRNVRPCAGRDTSVEDTLLHGVNVHWL